MQDPTGKKYLDFPPELLGGRGAADKARALAVAKEVGLDMGKLEKDLASPEVRNTLEENMRLAEAMGMNGTPSYRDRQAGRDRRGRRRQSEGKDRHRPLRQGDLLISANAL
jgi:Protein-disulfide isomerase